MRVGVCLSFAVALALGAAPVAASAQSVQEQYRALADQAQGELEAGQAELKILFDGDPADAVVCPHMAAAMKHFASARGTYSLLQQLATRGGYGDVAKSAGEMRDGAGDYIVKFTPYYDEHCAALTGAL